MIILSSYYAEDNLMLLSIFEKENIERGEFNNLMSRNLYAPMEMGQAKAWVFPFKNFQIYNYKYKNFNLK